MLVFYSDWSLLMKAKAVRWLAVTFSLILTFSRWEKEQPLVSFIKHENLQAESRSSFAQTLGAFPLSQRERAGVRENTAPPQFY